MKKRPAVNETSVVYHLHSFWRVAKGPAKKANYFHYLSKPGGKLGVVSMTSFSFNMNLMFPHELWVERGISSEWYKYMITKPIQSGVSAGVWQLYAHTH